MFVSLYGLRGGGGRENGQMIQRIINCNLKRTISIGCHIYLFAVGKQRIALKSVDTSNASDQMDGSNYRTDT